MFLVLNSQPVRIKEIKIPFEIIVSEYCCVIFAMASTGAAGVSIFSRVNEDFSTKPNLLLASTFKYYCAKTIPEKKVLSRIVTTFITDKYVYAFFLRIPHIGLFLSFSTTRLVSSVIVFDKIMQIKKETNTWLRNLCCNWRFQGTRFLWKEQTKNNQNQKAIILAFFKRRAARFSNFWNRRYTLIIQKLML